MSGNILSDSWHLGNSKNFYKCPLVELSLQDGERRTGFMPGGASLRHIRINRLKICVWWVGHKSTLLIMLFSMKLLTVSSFKFISLWDSFMDQFSHGVRTIHDCVSRIYCVIRPGRLSKAMARLLPTLCASGPCYLTLE